MLNFAGAVLLLFLLALPISLIAIAFRSLRPKAKWTALASAIGLVVSFVFFGYVADRQAREMGFLSADDRRSAEQAGVSDGSVWQLRRSQVEAAKKAEAEAAKAAKKAVAEAAAAAKLAEAEAAEAAKVAEAEAAKRVRKTEILPADYAKCLRNFGVCKGKFIKFEGVIVSIGGGSKSKIARITTPMHGFDVEMIGKLDASIVGSKVLFSGYLDEDHTWNDDVSRGELEAVLMNSTEVNAEKEARCGRGEGGQRFSRTGAAAEVKKDILGFYPGMSKEEFITRKKNGCADITGQLTEKLDQNLVKEITLHFLSGTPPTEMIATISEQFTARPTKADWSAEIKYATNPHFVYMPAFFPGKGNIGGPWAACSPNGGSMREPESKFDPQ